MEGVRVEGQEEVQVYLLADSLVATKLDTK